MSVAHHARESIGLALVTQKSGAALFGAGSIHDGVLTHPHHMTEEGQVRFRTEWERTHSGPENAYKTAILEDGMKYEPIATVNKDAQWIEARQFSVEEICR